MLEFFLRPSVGFAVIVFLLLYAIYNWSFSSQYLPALPWVGLREEWFAKTRCRWRSTIRYRETLQYAYQNYSRKGLACILSQPSEEIVLLPPASTEWIINQPDDVLNVKEAHIEALQSDYTFTDPAVVRQPYHEHVIKTDLTRQLGNLTMELVDELATGLDEIWGLDADQWKSVVVFKDMMAIIARTSNRIFVGLPLCRDPSYLSLAQNFARDIPLSALIIRRLPKALRPILAPLITLPNKYHARKLRQHLKPLIESRVSKFDAAKEESQLYPNDFLQWSIRNAQTRISDAPEEMSTHFLALRLLALNFAAIHTSTITITNAIFDLASSDPSLQYLEQLREEAAYVLAEDNGMWSKRGLSRMHKIDSALRESLRLSGFVAIGLTRKVVAKNGVTTPEGVHLPFGAKVAVCAYGIHNDEKNYESPEVYDALRFVKQRQLVDEAAAPGVENYIKKANFSMVSTSTEYQAFGHGRHACPGRWLGAQELKAVLAYIVLNYDIEPLSERPRGKWMASTILPPLKATIKVRRRKV